MKRPKFEVLCYYCNEPIKRFKHSLKGKFCSDNCAVDFATQTLKNEEYCPVDKNWTSIWCGGDIDACDNYDCAEHFRVK